MTTDTFTWESRPDIEAVRLTKLLRNHLRAAGVPDANRSYSKCKELLFRILDAQRNTCYFAGGDDRYCWNHPKDKTLKFLKLEWGHLVPRARGHRSGTPQMILMCARCNNHLQSSRTIEQLIPELEHKLAVLKLKIGSQPAVPDDGIASLGRA